MEKTTIITELPAGAEPNGYDRMKELKEFDDTKLGVKGLVDAGIQKVPRIFIRSPEQLAEELPNGNHMFQFPVINLEGLENKDRRKEIIDSLRSASETWGSFLLVNHGVPSRVMEEMIKGIQSFFEQDAEVKKKYYSRDVNNAVRLNTNINLFITKSAAWRDSFSCFLKGGPDFSPHQLPEFCRDIILEYNEYATSLAETLFELLSESLGLEPDYLKSIADGSAWVTNTSHYYPKCPEPELTLGTNCHFDPNFLAVVLNNGVSGLQVLHKNHWVDVPHIPGSFVINIGYLLQVATNDKYVGEYHRVLACRDDLRMSTATFFRPPESSILGPFKELLSEDNPPKYYEKPLKDYLKEVYHTGKKVATIDDLIKSPKPIDGLIKDPISNINYF